ncbi:hypothetical protein HZR84_00395 [Hyphobacterium sp. CCMP332]|nr:hypothetical protein HZR84_00395 [Hyphobacterium sp. CCMP332]
MKKLLFIFIFFSISYAGLAQDYIVTVKGDTFECKITKITERFIHFDYAVRDEIRSTVILLDQVQSYNRGIKKSNTIVNQSGTKSDANPTQDQSVSPYNTYNDQYNANKDKYDKSTGEESKAGLLRLSIMGAYSYLTAKGASGLSADLKAYEDELRSGYQFGASFHYFPYKSQTGYGLRVSRTGTSNSGTFSFFDPDLQESFTINVEDNISMVYFGPHFCGRYPTGLDQSALILGTSIGYFSYVNNAFAGQSVNFRGEGLGLMLDLGFDIQVAEGVLLHLFGSYIINSLSKITVNGSTVTFPDDTRQDNSHVNFGGGLTFLIPG